MTCGDDGKQGRLSALGARGRPSQLISNEPAGVADPSILTDQTDATQRTIKRAASRRPCDADRALRTGAKGQRRIRECKCFPLRTQLTLSDRELNSLALGQRNPGLVALSSNEDVADASGELAVENITNVNLSEDQSSARQHQTVIQDSHAQCRNLRGDALGERSLHSCPCSFLQWP